MSLSWGQRAQRGSPAPWQPFHTHRLQTTKAAAQNLSEESALLKPCPGMGGTQPPWDPSWNTPPASHQKPAPVFTLIQIQKGKFP